MDNPKMDVSRWVDERLSALAPGAEWTPDPRAALARLHRRSRARRRYWVLGSVAAGTAILALIFFQAPAACATPQACARSLWESAFPKHAPATVSVPVPSPAFKTAGSSAAPVTCEIYTDYECPACAQLYANIVPMLAADYVQTGKVRLIHRDFPLAMHAYSKTAARYANAAGLAGQYDLAVNRIFETQAIWGQTGDVDMQLAQVLPPDAMQKVRDLVAHDATLDDSVQTDLAMGAADHITQTPTLVIVHEGKRQPIAGAPSYGLLKSYLDRILAQDAGTPAQRSN